MTSSILKKCFSIFLVTVAVGLLAGCGTSGDASSSQGDPAQMLAEIDNGSGLSESQISPYRGALSRLESICSQPGEEIADMAEAGDEIADEEGVDPTLLEVLQGSAGMAHAITRNTGASGQGSCHTLISAWLTADITRGG